MSKDILYDEAFYIKSLMKNEENIISIFNEFLGTQNKYIKGFIDADFVFSTSANYGTEQPGSEMINNATNSVNKLISTHTGLSVQAASMQRATWQDSALSPIGWEIFIVAEEKNGNVTNPLEIGKYIFDYTMVEESGNPGVYYTPGRYIPNGFFSKATNACSVSIGKWFLAHNAFVITNAHLTVSKEKVKGTNGKIPLYVKINLSAKPAKFLSANEIKSWFKDSPESESRLYHLPDNFINQNDSNRTPSPINNSITLI